MAFLLGKLILLILLLALIVLALPFRFLFRGHVEVGTERFSFQGIAALSLFSFGLQLDSRDTQTYGIGPLKHPWIRRSRKPRRSAGSHRNSRRTLTRSMYRRLPVRAWIQVGRKTLTLESLQLQGTLGWTNPMITGLIWGALQALAGAFQLHSGLRKVTPDFSSGAGTDLTGEIRCRFRPLILFWFGFRTMRKFQRKQRKK
ncbi:MAG: hypothetical protein D6762_06375 [Candidatus Neomarinimicrobiota bacterium]|nr:MAG: hypothetical protein D6762_06375 [Candidatus Neomarinimicrobiota bacterium]